MCLLYGAAYDVPAVALRFFNVYGPRQALSNPYTGVLAIFAARLLNDHAPVVYEDGGQRRDFVHVADVGARLPAGARAGRRRRRRPVNVGSGRSAIGARDRRGARRACSARLIEPELPGELPRRRHPALLRRRDTRTRCAGLRSGGHAGGRNCRTRRLARGPSGNRPFRRGGRRARRTRADYVSCAPQPARR